MFSSLKEKLRLKKLPKIKTLQIVALVCISLLFLLIFLPNYVISTRYNNFLYYRIDDVPAKPALLVLGTTKYVGKRPNMYYWPRIQAAYALYKAGKAPKIVVSGDNSTKYYDEPSTMKDDLVKLGVPPENIYPDDAGLRTLDSVIRAKEVFGLNEYIIVSQEFHCKRALFISREHGQQTIAYCAETIKQPSHVKIMIREFFARIKAGIDVWLISKKPEHLGQQSDILKD